MAHCEVYGTNSTTGPGKKSAEVARDEVNQAHGTWLVVLVYDQSLTKAKYSSAVATGDQLERAFREHFPHYEVTGVD